MAREEAIDPKGARPRAGRARRAGRAACALAGASLVLAGCGGPPSQSLDEPRGTYPVEITKATFPKKQKLAKPSRLAISVRNVGTKTIPNVAVTLKSPGVPGATFDNGASGFNYRDPKVEDPSRPIFVVDTEPRGGQTAYTDTWALGVLGPGKTKTFAWDVTAVAARPYDIRYSVSGGLDGKAKAVTRSGEQPKGRFAGVVDNRAPQAKVASSGRDVLSSGGRVPPRNPRG